MILISCNNRTAREYFERPSLPTCIVLSDRVSMACNGLVVDVPEGLIVPMNNDIYLEAKKYYADREYGHYMCLKFPSKCKK